MSHPVLELQAADTRADQLQHRRRHLPEQQAVDTAKAALHAWQREVDALTRTLDELDRAIAESESQSAALDEQRQRLERQMKTIIAPREAEALQHELATIAERRSQLDDGELEALEEQSRVDDELTERRRLEPELRGALEAASAAAGAATAEIDRELTDLAARHPELRSEVDPALLDRYDQLRRMHVVAAAALKGTRCDGCHMDLSASELDEARAAAASGDGVTDCPQCNRLLVI